MISTTRYLRSSLGAGARKVQDLRARFKTVEEIREARGVTLLRQWLSDEQRRQFNASKSFEVIGCDSRKRYRIVHGTGTNVHELGDDGRPTMGFCFVPSGGLVAGDVMLAQKIALETNERFALAVANKFPIQGHDRENPCPLPRRAY
ncbi:hypothetical protein JQ605_35705 [Bradyrhizobium sp. AUGA SZCCT0042]|nr:hypothetical protein [Bradyrhizobium sp. AUGA SZCCT0042]